MTSRLYVQFEKQKKIACCVALVGLFSAIVGRVLLAAAPHNQQKNSSSEKQQSSDQFLTGISTYLANISSGKQKLPYCLMTQLSSGTQGVIVVGDLHKDVATWKKVKQDWVKKGILLGNGNINEKYKIVFLGDYSSLDSSKTGGV